ncbi:hypothetical protein [Ralstonia solanacearum]|uniref:hypothetical protein n=1 Tax=Ralstonia solanacearum TaxID=305 RepID=UPI000B236B5B|nr:hypothetical protein [Ralstonia solanacearum]
MSYGNFKKWGTPPYKVISQEVINDNPPPKIKEIFRIQITSSGKLMDKIYHSLDKAEKDCEELIKNYPNPN